MNIERFPSATALASALAERVVSAIAARPDLVIGLPAGRTPILLYREIVTATRARNVSWSRVRTFNVDEFVGTSGHAMQPFQRFMHEHLHAHLDVDPRHVDFPNGRARDAAAECDRYERALLNAGGLDLLLLGIGVNGHIGFNEPGASFFARTHRARLTEESRQANAYLFGGDANAVPDEALTMGLATMMAARSIIVVATGELKARAVAAMVDQPITTAVPASFLQLHRDVTVALDAEAGARLAPSRP